VASYSYRKLSLDKMIEACRAADIKYVTVKDVHVPQTDSPEAIRAACDKIREAGLTILGGGVINMKAADEAAIRKNFEYAKLCAFPLIVASPVIEALDLVEAMVKEYGIPVAIHNHGPEDKLYPAPKDVLAHLKKRDERMGVCMDIGHTVRAGADPARSAAECGRRLLDLHIKDLRDLKVKESQVAAGRGAIDLVALLRQLHKMKFQGHVAVEYEVDADAPEAGVRESMGYLRGVAAALGAA
jgi:sugar phosphate isomerase/epimerase